MNDNALCRAASGFAWVFLSKQIVSYKTVSTCFIIIVSFILNCVVYDISEPNHTYHCIPNGYFTMKYTQYPIYPTLSFNLERHKDTNRQTDKSTDIATYRLNRPRGQFSENYIWSKYERRFFIKEFHTMCIAWSMKRVFPTTILKVRKTVTRVLPLHFLTYEHISWQFMFCGAVLVC